MEEKAADEGTAGSGDTENIVEVRITMPQAMIPSRCVIACTSRRPVPGQV